MAPARRLRSLFARLLRYIADAVQPPAHVVAEAPLPAAAAGNEHWLALVQERVPELLTGSGIHAGASLPDRPAVPSPQWPPPAALTERHRSRALTYIDASQQDDFRRRRSAPKFATVRMLRRKFRPAGRAAPKPAAQGTQQSASTETTSTGRHTARPDVSNPTTSSRRPTAAGFDASRPRAAIADEGHLAPGGRRRGSVAPLGTIWTVPPAQSDAAPQFDQNELRPHAARNEWPPLGTMSKTPGVQPDFAVAGAQVPESPAWSEESRDDERWPELPDDANLWQPPTSAFDSDNLKRLDDEQRGW